MLEQAANEGSLRVQLGIASRELVKDLEHLVATIPVTFRLVDLLILEGEANVEWKFFDFKSLEFRVNGFCEETLWCRFKLWL